MLFAGWDTNTDGNLWVTDGTQGGTSELAVAGAAASGLIATDGYSLMVSDMVAFGGKVLFEGDNASGYGGLWVTNGTAAGTSELSITGANAGGLFYGPSNAADHDLSPDFTALGTKVLFTGIDAAGNYGLWVTTGTAAGTSELSIAGAYASGYGIDATNMAVFGSEVLFNGTDASGLDQLWVTNGTAAGTSELAIAGAYYYGLEPTDITVFGTKVLFKGVDADGNLGLWISDGTAAGTSELVVSGAYATSSYYTGSAGVDPSDITVLGSKAFFSGKDADGIQHLWVTDGTAAGTSEFFPQLYSTLDPTELAVLLSNVTTVGSGQTLTVASGQTDTSDVIQNGGTENVLSGGKTNSATVAKGGKLNIASGGTANSAIISGGTVYVSGTSSSATISAGGEQDVLAGGTIASTTILAGGSSVIFAGGTGDPTTIDAGGTETINSGGSDTGVIVNGGALLVYGSAPNAAVSGGGGIIVEKGGTASGATLSSSGTIVIYSGGTASGGTVTNGGTVIVSSGATVSGMTIGSGGTLLISSGATVSSVVVLSGGTVEYFGTSPAGVNVLSGGKAVQLDAASSSALTYIYQSGLNYYVNSSSLASPINFASTTGSNLLGNLSVTTNSDGSFNVFWTSGSASGGNATYSAFENSYSASGTLNSSTALFNNGVAAGGAAAGALTDYFNGATNGSSGSSAFYAFENNGTFYVVGHGTSQIQFATGTNIGNISISANSDNSFQVFWTTSTTSGSTTTYTATENSYAANGTLTGTRQIGSQDLFTASGYPVTGNFFSGDGNGSAYVYAYQNGTTYYVATNTVTTPIQFTSGSTIGNVSTSLNSDGTFAVFWTSFSASNPANYTAFKNIYSAAGTLTSSTQIGSYSESTLAYTDYFAASTAATSRPLFTTGVDSVNFNALSAAQLQQASNNPQSMYADFGGNGDVTTLPSASEMQTLGWSAGAFFYDGSLSGQIYKVAGSNADNDIALGAGYDTVYGSPGNDVIVGGAGPDLFDFQDGAFANFSGFSAGTTQTIVGGHASFVPVTLPSQQNLLLLPGTPNDYTIKVNLVGGDVFSAARTTITTTGADGFQPGITFNTTGIERVEFDSFVNLPNVTLTGGTMASEALKLADEVYGYSATVRGFHTQDPLADEAQENPGSSLYSASAVGVSSNSATAAVSRGWYALQAIDLGMGAADFLQQGNTRYTFVNGYYQAYSTDDALPSLLGGDHPEADALVVAGNVNGKKTLAISFSGTDQTADFWDYFTFATYYAKYKPLIDALKAYVANNGIQQILVSGHSLGAGALQYFMNDFASSSIPVYAYTAGTPGSEVDTGDSRIVNFIHTDDVVPKLGTLSQAAPVLSKATYILGIAGFGTPLSTASNLASSLLGTISAKYRTGETIKIDSDVADFMGTAEHKVGLYEQDTLKLEFFATDANSPFEAVAAAIANSDETVLRNLLLTYPGATLQVAVGQPWVFNTTTGVVGGTFNAAGLAGYNSDVRAYSADQYVLGNENSAFGTTFMVAQGTLVAAASQRVFDGGSNSNNNRIVLPYAASNFQYSQQTPDGKGGYLSTRWSIR